MTIFMEVAKEILISEIIRIIEDYQSILNGYTVQDRELAKIKKELAENLLTEIGELTSEDGDEANLKALSRKLKDAESKSTEAAKLKSLGPGRFKTNMDNLTILLRDIHLRLGQPPLDALKVLDRAFPKKDAKNDLLGIYAYNLARYYANLCKTMHDEKTGGLLSNTAASISNNPSWSSVPEVREKTHALIGQNIEKFRQIKVEKLDSESQRAVLQLLLSDLQTKYVDLLASYTSLRIVAAAKSAASTVTGVVSKVVTGAFTLFSATKSSEAAAVADKAVEKQPESHAENSDDFLLQCIDDARLYIAPEDYMGLAKLVNSGESNASPVPTSTLASSASTS